MAKKKEQVVPGYDVDRTAIDGKMKFAVKTFVFGGDV